MFGKMGKALSVLTVAIALSLTACSGGGKGGEGGGATPSGGTQGARPGGNLTIASVVDAQPGSVLAQRNGNNQWVQQVFQYLTRANPETLKPEPYLATEWTISKDNLTYEVKLRDDAVFHTGRPLTADDVVYSYEQVKDPANASQLRFIAEAMKSIEAVDKHTVKFTLSQPVAGIFDLFNLTPIVDKETFDSIKSGERVIGSGPYEWKSWSPGSEIKLTKFKDYPDADKVNLDNITIKILSDSTAQISAMRSGKAQLTWSMGSRDIQTFAKDPKFDISKINHVIYNIGFDTTSTVLKSKQARQAVAYSIDTDRIIKQVFSGAAFQTNLYWDPRDPSYDKTQASKYTYNVDKAKKLVQEAGIEGQAVKLAVQGIPINKGAAEIIRNNLEAVGLKAQIITYTSQEFNERQVARDMGADIFIMQFGGGWSAATQVFAQSTLAENNLSKWTDPKWGELKKKVASTSLEERPQAVKEMTDYMLDEVFTVAFLQSEAEILNTADLHDVWYAPGGGLVLTEAWLGK